MAVVMRSRLFGKQGKVVFTKYTSEAQTFCAKHLHIVHQMPLNILKVPLNLNKINPCTSSKFHKSSYINNNLYATLGVSKSADQSTIKKAYYKLANKCHPDAKRFREVSEAYGVLSDDDKRKEYDDTLGATNEAGAGHVGGHRGFGGGGSASQNKAFEEVFRKVIVTIDLTITKAYYKLANKYHAEAKKFREVSEAYGVLSDDDKRKEYDDTLGATNEAGAGHVGGGRSASQNKAFGEMFRKIFVTMDLTFEEATKGVNKDISINLNKRCLRCQGNGAAIMSHLFNVHMYVCRACYGKGDTVERKTISVAVPAGVEDGQTLRMPEQGSEEIYIHFKVAKSSISRRDGVKVFSDVTISLSQAILGGSKKIPGIYGDVMLPIPVGTPADARILLSGNKKVGGFGCGDHYVHIKIKMPVKLTEQQRLLIQAYSEYEKKEDKGVHTNGDERNAHGFLK